MNEQLLLDPFNPDWSSPKYWLNLCQMPIFFLAVCSPIAFLANSWLALAVEDSRNRDFFCGVLIQVVGTFFFLTIFPFFAVLIQVLSYMSTHHSGSVHHSLCVHECHVLRHLFPCFLHPLPWLRPSEGWTTWSPSGPPALLGRPLLLRPGQPLRPPPLLHHQGQLPWRHRSRQGVLDGISKGANSWQC